MAMSSSDIEGVYCHANFTAMLANEQPETIPAGWAAGSYGLVS